MLIIATYVSGGLGTQVDGLLGGGRRSSVVLVADEVVAVVRQELGLYGVGSCR